MAPQLFTAEAPRPDGVQDAVQRAHLQRYHHFRDECPSEVEYLEGLWETYSGLGLADPNFLDSFPHECCARIWEMRLACTLHGWGWQLIAASNSQDGPDFGVRFADDRVVWIEACTPTDGAEEVEGKRNPDKVRAEPGQVLWGKELDRTLFLRLVNSIQEKRRQRRKWIDAGIIQENDGFIIALSGAMLSEALIEREDAPPRIVRCLFGVGEPQFTVSLDGKVGDGGFATQLSVPRKGGTKEAWTNLFRNPHAPDVSGILFGASYLKERPEKRGHEAGSDYISLTTLSPTLRCPKFPFHVSGSRGVTSGTPSPPRTTLTFCSWTGTIAGCPRFERLGFESCRMDARHSRSRFRLVRQTSWEMSRTP